MLQQAARKAVAECVGAFLFPFKMDSRSLETYPYKGADRTRIEIRIRRKLPHKNVIRVGFRPCVLQIVLFGKLNDAFSVTLNVAILC